MSTIGARIYGLAAILIGITCLLWDKFEVGWFPPPAGLPGYAALAYLVGALLIAGGVLINLPRQLSAWGAGLLTAVFATGLVLLDFTRLALHLTDFGYWDSSLEQVAVVAGGLIAFAMSAKMEPKLSSRLQHGARIVFGLSLFSFGAAHFVYPELTWPLVPKWLPPSQIFWADFTGVAAPLAGLAIIVGRFDLLAARLLTLMYIVFGVLVHARLLLADPTDHGKWLEHDVNLILVGVAWIVADSIAAKRRAAAPLPGP